MLIPDITEQKRVGLSLTGEAPCTLPSCAYVQSVKSEQVLNSFFFSEPASGSSPYWWDDGEWR